MRDGLRYYLILQRGKTAATFAGTGQKAEMMKKTVADYGLVVQEVTKKEFLEKRATQ